MQTELFNIGIQLVESYLTQSMMNSISCLEQITNQMDACLQHVDLIQSSEYMMKQLENKVTDLTGSVTGKAGHSNRVF